MWCFLQFTKILLDFVFCASAHCCILDFVFCNCFATISNAQWQWPVTMQGKGPQKTGVVYFRPKYLFVHSQLILVNTATTSGGILFSSWCTFQHREREILAFIGLFCRDFLYFSVFFYWPKYCGGVQKCTNMRCDYISIGLISQSPFYLNFENSLHYNSSRHLYVTPCLLRN